MVTECILDLTVWVARWCHSVVLHSVVLIFSGVGPEPCPGLFRLSQRWLACVSNAHVLVVFDSFFSFSCCCTPVVNRLLSCLNVTSPVVVLLLSFSSSRFLFIFVLFSVLIILSVLLLLLSSSPAVVVLFRPRILISFWRYPGVVFLPSLLLWLLRRRDSVARALCVCLCWRARRFYFSLLLPIAWRRECLYFVHQSSLPLLFTPTFKINNNDRNHPAATRVSESGSGTHTHTQKYRFLSKTLSRSCGNNAAYRAFHFQYNYHGAIMFALSGNVNHDALAGTETQMHQCLICASPKHRTGQLASESETTVLTFLPKAN